VRVSIGECALLACALPADTAHIAVKARHAAAGSALAALRTRSWPSAPPSVRTRLLSGRGR